MKKKRSLRNILFRAITIPAVAGLLILAGVIFLSLRIIYTGIVDRQNLVIESLAQQGNRFLAETGRLMGTVAATVADLPVENQGRLLVESRRNYPRFTAFYLLDDTGRVILEDVDTLSLIDLDLSSERYFRAARQSGDIYFSDPFLSLSSGQTSLTVAVPILAGQKFQGVLVGELSLDLLQQQIIEQADLGENSISFIVDQRGTLLAHPTQQFVQERRHYGDLPLVQAGLDGRETVEFFYDDDQQAWLIGSVTTMTPGWVVVTMQPFATVAQPIIHMFIIAAIALGLSLMLFFVVQRRSLQQITKPVALLAQKADALASGQYEELSSRQMGECYEIVSLGYSFAGMVEAVQERDQTVARQLEELKRAQEETRRTQTFLDAIVENIPNTILVKETDHLTYVLCNKASEALFGFIKEEIVGRTAYEFFPKEEADRFTAQDREALTGRNLLDIPEEIVHTRDKGPRLLHTKKLPFLEKDGQPQYLLSISEDITARKEAEQALRDSEEKNRALSEATYEALFFSDQGFCVEANHVASEMFGYSYDELIGIFGTDVIAPESKEIVKRNMLSGYEEPYEAMAQRKDGTTFPAEFEGRMYEYKGKRVRVTTVRDITARKQAEEALRESEEKYRQLFEMESDAIFLIDNATGQILEANVAAAKLYGYSREELLAKKNVDLSAEADKTRQATREERRLVPIRWHRRGDGTIFPVEIAATHFDWRGRQVHIAAIRDITERMRGEEALRESEERYRQSVENSPNPIFSVGRMGFIQTWNRACEQIFQYEAAEVIGQTYQKLLWNPEDLPDLEAKVGLVFQQESLPDVDLSYRCKNGARRLTVSRLYPLLDREGQVEGCMFANTDITERKRNEEALLLNDVRMTALLKLNQMTGATLQEITDYALEEAVGLTRSEIGYLAFLNEDETVLTMFSWSKSAMEQCQISDKPIIYPVETTGLWGEAIRQRKPVITNDYSTDSPYKKGYPVGHVPVSRHMNVPVFDGERIVAVAGVGNKKELYDESDVRQLTLLMQGMWRQIQRKAAEEEIQRLNEELEQRVIERTAQLEAANKELESFAYSVSHDLRSPLRSIDGFSQMLVEDYGHILPVGGQDYLQRVRAASQRMGQLIDDLLKLSRLTRGELHREPVALSPMVEEITADLQSSEPERRAEFIIAPAVMATGDVRLLRVVLENLLNNAWKFTGKEARAKIEFGCIQENGHHTFYVRDNGAGFDMAYADKLFRPFQRLHRVTEFDGTGIGLATVQRIIHRHGGRVWAEGAVGYGATFYFALKEK